MRRNEKLDGNTEIDRLVGFGGRAREAGFGNLVAGNVYFDGVGQRVPGSNNPEAIVTEGTLPHFEGTPAAVSSYGWILKLPHLRGKPAQAGDMVTILSGIVEPVAKRYFMIAQAVDSLTSLMAEPLPPSTSSPGSPVNYVISISSGYVHETYQDNLIDMTGTGSANVGIQLNASAFDTRILNNRIISAGGMDIHSRSNSVDFSAPSSAPDGWSPLPMMDTIVDGNTIENSGSDTTGALSIRVEHKPQQRPNSGRTYYVGTFTNNAIYWSGGVQKSANFGEPSRNGKSAWYPGSPDYPWVDSGELRLIVRDNWGVGPAGRRRESMSSPRTSRPTAQPSRPESRIP